MKKRLLLVCVGLLTMSCSNKLSESKVEDLVNDCLTKSPSFGKQIIYTGKVSYMAESDVNMYKELQKKGLLTIEPKEEKSSYFTSKYNLITLTDKAQPFIIETKPNHAENTINTVKLYTNKLDKVGGIQEIPSMNMAEVSITFKKADKTPFYDALEKDKTDFTTKKIALKKTENNGWVYCE